MFNPNSISSVTEALDKEIKLHLSEEYTGGPLAKYTPTNIVKETDRIFLK